MTRYICDLNPAYGSKGERRYAVFRAEPATITRVAQFQSRRVGDRHACKLQVAHDLARLGLAPTVEA